MLITVFFTNLIVISVVVCQSIYNSDEEIWDENSHIDRPIEYCNLKETNCGNSLVCKPFGNMVVTETLFTMDECAKMTVAQFDKELSARFLATVNQLRNNISLGNVKGWRGATNMPKMKWSDEFAEYARKNVIPKSCIRYTQNQDCNTVTETEEKYKLVSVTTSNVDSFFERLGNINELK